MTVCLGYNYTMYIKDEIISPLELNQTFSLFNKSGLKHYERLLRRL